MRGAARLQTLKLQEQWFPHGRKSRRFRQFAQLAPAVQARPEEKH
jgi:hypothetical protein